MYSLSLQVPKDTVTLEVVHRFPFMCSVTNPIFKASAHAESIMGWGESAASAACLQQVLLHKKHLLPCKWDQGQKERYCILRESTSPTQRIAHPHLQLQFSSDTGSLVPSCNTWGTYCPKPTLTHGHRRPGAGCQVVFCSISWGGIFLRRQILEHSPWT